MASAPEHAYPADGAGSAKYCSAGLPWGLEAGPNRGVNVSRDLQPCTRPRLMPALLPYLPRVVATTATGKVEHPLRVFSALRVPLHHGMPLAAVWAEHQRADLELLGAIHDCQRDARV